MPIKPNLCVLLIQSYFSLCWGNVLQIALELIGAQCTNQFQILIIFFWCQVNLNLCIFVTDLLEIMQSAKYYPSTNWRTLSLMLLCIQLGSSGYFLSAVVTLLQHNLLFMNTNQMDGLTNLKFLACLHKRGLIHNILLQTNLGYFSYDLCNVFWFGILGRK